MASAAGASEPLTTTVHVTNIHCPSCVSHAEDVLSPLSDAIDDIYISIIDHVVRVQHRNYISDEIAQQLIGAAFEVEHVTVTNSAGQIINDYDVEPPKATVPGSFLGTLFLSKAQKQHMKNCNACQQYRSRKTTWTDLLGKKRTRRHSTTTDIETRGAETVVIESKTMPKLNHKETHDKPGEVHIVQYIIEGMTCASCVSAISQEVRKFDYVRSVDVNLVANTAKVVLEGPRERAQEVRDSIEDIGYGAEIESVQSSESTPQSEDIFEVSLATEGMTCGSCVGTITRGLQEFPFVQHVSVDLLNNSTTVEFKGEQNASAITGRINDLGYDAHIVNVRRVTSAVTSRESIERSIQIGINGMYCPKCPQNITTALSRTFTGTVNITKTPTLKSPRMTIIYTPSPPETTIRGILNIINSVDPACSASVYHPPSLEQRSRSIQRKERNRILRHLLVVFLVAIPSFIIGVVYMSLVPSSNATRQWFAEPVWAGNAKRMDWALFILTTPAMFYGASLFHIRALKEIWTLWRPKSRIPLLRRFYRFGSMNLLMSAGTSVAYFASLAVLIIDATSQMSVTHTGRGTSTYFDTVTFLTFFILIGRYLEAYSKAKTGDAVSMLANLRPNTALLVEKAATDDQMANGTHTSRISVDLLEVGDTVSVLHGSCPPTDGTIIEQGTFVFDESSLTGESRPVRKGKGDKIFTGSTNIGDPVRMTVTELGEKSMLDQIVNVVREGQAKRAPIERFADTLTGYFTPIITLLAILTWIIWLALGESGALPQGWLDVDEGSWSYWSVEFAIAVFVVACPCGIGLAAPTALFVGGGLAAKSGILVQGGGEAFQEASRLDAIVFDKTGTLTEGRMTVTDVEFLSTASKIEKPIVFGMTKLLEEASSHPIASAIAQRCLQELINSNPQKIKVTNIREISGQGMHGHFEVESDHGHISYEAVIGNERLLNNPAITRNLVDDSSKPRSQSSAWANNVFLASTVSQLQAAGKSTAILAIRQIEVSEKDGSNLYAPVAVFAITDPIREEAPRVLESLRAQGLDVYMCTGDNARTAQSIASQLSIPAANVRAGVMPQDKAGFLHELQHPPSKRRIIGFVGDGTNDTPALTVADVSIAISHPEGGGSDIALTSSSFVLLNSDLASVLNLVKLSKRVFLRVKLNFGWAAIYNICLIPVAAGVFFPIGATWGDDAHGGFRLNPVWASVAMAGSSISVVLSSLALKLPAINFRRFSGSG